MGVPVTATGHGGVIDIVRPGATGALFPPGDADALASAVETCLQLPGDTLRTFVLKNFALEHMVQQTMTVYQDLVG